MIITLNGFILYCLCGLLTIIAAPIFKKAEYFSQGDTISYKKAFTSFGLGMYVSAFLFWPFVGVVYVYILFEFLFKLIGKNSPLKQNEYRQYVEQEYRRIMKKEGLEW